MTINSVMSTGLQGMHNSYSAIESAANKIARVHTDPSVSSTESGVVNSLSINLSEGSGSVGNNQAAAFDSFAVDGAQQSIATRGNFQENIIDPIIEMKIQQHVFDASAKVVKSADEMLGTIMDIKA